MLEHVGADHYVKRARPIARGKRVRGPPLVISLPGLDRDTRIRFHPGEKNAAVPDLAAKVPSRGAEIEQPQALGERSNAAAQQIVRGAGNLLPGVFFDGVHLLEVISYELSVVSFQKSGVIPELTYLWFSN